MAIVRFSSLHHTPAKMGQSFVAGMGAENSPTDPLSNHGADEFVFDPSNGTFASLQEPASVSSLFRDNNGIESSFFM